MVETIRREGIVDFKAEREKAIQFGQTMKIFRGIPVFYSKSGEPAAESDGIPTEEVERRNQIVSRANIQRSFGR